MTADTRSAFLMFLTLVACSRPVPQKWPAAVNGHSSTVVLEVTSAALSQRTLDDPDAFPPNLVVRFSATGESLFGSEDFSTTSGFLYTKYHLDNDYTPDSGNVTLGRDGRVYASTSKGGKNEFYPIGTFNPEDLRTGCRLKKVDYGRNLRSFTLSINESFGYRFSQYNMSVDDSVASVPASEAIGQHRLLSVQDFPACYTGRDYGRTVRPKAIMAAPEGAESCLKRRWWLAPRGTTFPVSHFSLFWGEILTLRVGPDRIPAGIHFTWPREDGADEILVATHFDPLRVRDRQLLNFMEEYKHLDFERELLDAIGSEAVLKRDLVRFKGLPGGGTARYADWAIDVAGQQIVLRLSGPSGNTVSIDILAGDGPLVSLCTFQ